MTFLPIERSPDGLKARRVEAGENDTYLSFYCCGTDDVAAQLADGARGLHTYNRQTVMK